MAVFCLHIDKLDFVVYSVVFNRLTIRFIAFSRTNGCKKSIEMFLIFHKKHYLCTAIKDGSVAQLDRATPF